MLGRNQIANMAIRDAREIVGFLDATRSPWTFFPLGHTARTARNSNASGGSAAAYHDQAKKADREISVVVIEGELRSS